MTKKTQFKKQYNIYLKQWSLN